MVERISDGVWQPAKLLPSEQALAEEFGVSQGTVRKALDTLVAENLVERRQGKGTYVAQHTQESAQFRFFKLTHDGLGAVAPDSRDTCVSKRAATLQAQASLGLSESDDIFVVTRIRHAKDMAIASETIALPAKRFPGFGDHAPLPNTLYTLYQAEFGVCIAGARERLKAVAADEELASRLGAPVGSPLLAVERVAYDIARQPVELRCTHYRTDTFHYGVDLT